MNSKKTYTFNTLKNMKNLNTISETDLTPPPNPKSHKAALTFLTFSIFLLLSYVGIIYYNFKQENILTKIAQENIQNKKIETFLNTQKSISKDTITLNTKLKFVTYYSDGNVLEEIRRPNSLDINTSKDTIIKNYEGWELEKFSEAEVIFSKYLNNESPNYYIIGEKDGYIAIYYDDPELGLRLRDITNKSVEGFNAEEKAKILKGIRIYGQENLIKTLENYTS